MANYYIPLVATPQNNSGGGSDLPAVTADDNGDVLTVVNGQWDKAAPSGGGGAFYVTFSYGGEMPFTPSEEYPVTADKTFAEIEAAYEAGMTIIGQGDLDSELSCFAPTLGMYCPAAGDDPAGFVFTFPLYVSGSSSGSGGYYYRVQYASVWFTEDGPSGNGEEYKFSKEP